MKTFLAIMIASLILPFTAAATTDATIALVPNTSIVKVGEVFSLDLKIDTSNEPIDGVDIYSLRFDPAYFQALQITEGSLMPVTPAKIIDNTRGLVQFSQITAGGTHFTGDGTLATVTFKVLKIGTTPITLDFIPGVTVDSNMAYQGIDRLGFVNNALITVTQDLGFDVPSDFLQLSDLNNDGIVNSIDFSILNMDFQG